MRPEVEALLTSVKNETDPLEKGRLLTSLRKVHDMKLKDISSYLDYTQAHVSNLMRLTKLPELISDGYYGGLLKYTHLLLLSRLNDQGEMVELYEKILQDSLSTPQLDELALE